MKLLVLGLCVTICSSIAEGSYLYRQVLPWTNFQPYIQAGSDSSVLPSLKPSSRRRGPSENGKIAQWTPYHPYMQASFDALSSLIPTPHLSSKRRIPFEKEEDVPYTFNHPYIHQASSNPLSSLIPPPNPGSGQRASAERRKDSSEEFFRSAAEVLLKKVESTLTQNSSPRIDVDDALLQFLSTNICPVHDHFKALLSSPAQDARAESQKPETAVISEGEIEQKDTKANQTDENPIGAILGFYGVNVDGVSESEKARLLIETFINKGFIPKDFVYEGFEVTTDQKEEVKENNTQSSSLDLGVLRTEKMDVLLELLVEKLMERGFISEALSITKIDQKDNANVDIKEEHNFQSEESQKDSWKAISEGAAQVDNNIKKTKETEVISPQEELHLESNNESSSIDSQKSDFIEVRTVMEENKTATKQIVRDAEMLEKSTIYEKIAKAPAKEKSKIEESATKVSFTEADLIKENNGVGETVMETINEKDLRESDNSEKMKNSSQKSQTQENADTSLPQSSFSQQNNKTDNATSQKPTQDDDYDDIDALIEKIMMKSSRRANSKADQSNRDIFADEIRRRLMQKVRNPRMEMGNVMLDGLNRFSTSGLRVNNKKGKTTIIARLDFGPVNVLPTSPLLRSEKYVPSARFLLQTVIKLYVDQIPLRAIPLVRIGRVEVERLEGKDIFVSNCLDMDYKKREEFANKIASKVNKLEFDSHLKKILIPLALDENIASLFLYKI